MSILNCFFNVLKKYKVILFPETAKLNNVQKPATHNFK